jgi:hypothetical protein
MSDIKEKNQFIQMLSLFQQGFETVSSPCYITISKNWLAIYDDIGNKRHLIDNLLVLPEIFFENQDIELKLFLGSTVAFSCLKSYYLNASSDDIQWFHEKKYLHTSIQNIKKITDTLNVEEKNNLLRKILPYIVVESDSFLGGVIEEDLNMTLLLLKDFSQTEKLTTLCQFAKNNMRTEEDFSKFKGYLVSNHNTPADKKIVAHYLSEYPGIQDYLDEKELILFNDEEKIFHFQINGYKVMQFLNKISNSNNGSVDDSISIRGVGTLTEKFFQACENMQQYTAIHRVSMTKEFFNNEQTTFVYCHTYNRDLNQKKIINWFMQYLKSCKYDTEVNAQKWIKSFMLYEKLEKMKEKNNLNINHKEKGFKI